MIIVFIYNIILPCPEDYSVSHSNFNFPVLLYSLSLENRISRLVTRVLIKRMKRLYKYTRKYIL